MSNKGILMFFYPSNKQLMPQTREDDVHGYCANASKLACVFAFLCVYVCLRAGVCE